MSTHIPFQTAVRTAAVALLTEYATDAGLGLQVYRGRPASLFPPTGFVDRIVERVTYIGHVRQRVLRAEVLVIFGLFDSGEAVDQKDAFVDGFLDWVTDRWYAAWPGTTLAGVEFVDEPAYVPDWRPANVTNGPNPTYYATRLVLEGFAGG